MSARTYPREWFRVPEWADKPEPKTFIKETEHRLYDARRRIFHKQTGYHTWYPTLEEAQAAIDARNEEKAKTEACGRIRDAAPELLEALRTLRDYGCPVCNGDCASANPPVNTCPMQLSRAAIAKATGAA